MEIIVIGMLGNIVITNVLLVLALLQSHKVMIAIKMIGGIVMEATSYSVIMVVMGMTVVIRKFPGLIVHSAAQMETVIQILA